MGIAREQRPYIVQDTMLEISTFSSMPLFCHALTERVCFNMRPLSLGKVPYHL